MLTSTVLRTLRSDVFVWKCFMVLTVAITCCESTFEWSCSTPVNDVAFFPDIPTDVSDLVIGIGKTISTSVGTIYIYPVPQDAQRCSGTVTGVRYCYRAGESVHFNLFIFDDPVNSTRNPDRTEFGISQVISLTNNGSMCSESVCCASSTFSADTQFQLLQTGVFTYGIGVVLSSILGFVDATAFGVPSYTLNAAELMNSMITIDPFGATSNTLRIVQFIIAVNDSSTTNPSSAFTDPSTTDPSTEATPESSSLPVVLGAVVGALVFVLLLIIAVIVLFVCICMRMKSTVKQNLKGMRYTIWKSGTGEVIMDPNSPTQLAEALNNNPSYKANTDFPIYAEVDATLIETMSHEYDTVTPDEQTQLSEPEDYTYDTVPDQPAEVEDPVLVYKGGEPEKREPEAGQPEEGEPEKGEQEAGEADYCISDYETIEARCTQAGEQNPTEPENTDFSITDAIFMVPAFDVNSLCDQLL